MSIPNQNILTELTIAFKTSAENAVNLIMPYANGLLAKLVVIDLIIITIFLVLGNQYKRKNTAGTILHLSLKYGAFIYLVTCYKDIINAIIASFFKIGGLVGGTPIPATTFSSPSTISEIGLKLMLPFWNNYVDNNIGKILVDLTTFIAGAATGGLSSLVIIATQVAVGTVQPNSIVVMLLMLLITILSIGCFFLMAIHVFVIQIEFGIIAALTIILIPFGAWDQTEFIFSNAKHNIIGFGLKYMVLTTILSISMAILTNLQLPVSPSYTEMLMFFVVVAGLTTMTIFLPGRIAADIQG